MVYTLASKASVARHESSTLSIGTNMKLNEYQEKSLKTAIYPNKGDNYSYPTLGLTGEAGEVADKISKVIRDKDGVLSQADRLEVAKELGDVLWYAAVLAYELGVSLETVAQMNIDKLEDRRKRNKIGGSGDNR